MLYTVKVKNIVAAKNLTHIEARNKALQLEHLFLGIEIIPEVNDESNSESQQYPA